MNKDQKLWRSIAAEIGDIALPDPSEFHDESFQRLAAGIVEDIRKLQSNTAFYSTFETGELWLKATMDPPPDNPDFPLGAFDGKAVVIDHPERIVVVKDTEDEKCSECPHKPHMASECIFGDEACPCPAGPEIPDSPVDAFVEASDLPDEMLDQESLAKSREYLNAPVEDSFAEDTERLASHTEWLQGVEDYARDHDLVAGKDYLPEYGIPGRDFDPKEQSWKLPQDHPDWTPF